jgi:predicted PurR-regulated permease PerM
VPDSIATEPPIPPTPSPLDTETSGLLRIAASCVIAATVVATLYLGRPVLLPFALSILVAFALAPLVSALGGLGMPRAPSVICAVAFAVAIFACLSMFIGTQLAHLAPDVPRYQATLLHKIETIRSSAARSDLFRSATGVFSKFDNAISGNAALQSPAPGTLATANPQHAVPVEIRPPDPGAFQIFENVADPLLMPLAGAALVIVFVIFILIQKEDLRDRFISLTGAGDLQRTTRAIDEGAQRLSRYLLLQTTVNACFGVLIAAGLWAIGIPSPALWGLIAGIARFVPYVGLPVAAVLPLTLGLAIDPGWSMVVLTAALMFGSEALTGQFIEPWLYGRHMGVSAVAIILCAVFWTWIWGPIGLLLATPLTMCVAIMGRHVEHLKFLDILLSDRAPLSPEEAFYLSMLGGKPDEEAMRAEMMLKDAPLTEYLDTVAIRGLALARQDEDRGTLDAAGGEKIQAALRQLLEDLSDAPSAFGGVAPSDAREGDRSEVLCIAGRGVLDRAAAFLLCTVLESRGIAAQVIPAEMTSSARIAALDHRGARVACLSYLPPVHEKNVRYLVRRLRKQLPDTLIIAGLWNDDHTDTSFLDAIEAMSCDAIATSLSDAAAQIAGVLKREGGAGDVASSEATSRELQGAEM